MTLTFGYSTQHEPPAPVLTVAVSVPSDLAKPTVEMSALCDSGADLTCLPADVIERLGLLEVDEVEIAGYDGRTKLRPLYAARLDVAGGHSQIVRFVPTTSGDALLGRDVLNSLRLELDGPARKLTLL